MTSLNVEGGVELVAAASCDLSFVGAIGVITKNTHPRSSMKFYNLKIKRALDQRKQGNALAVVTNTNEWIETQFCLGRSKKQHSVCSPDLMQHE